MGVGVKIGSSYRLLSVLPGKIRKMGLESPNLVNLILSIMWKLGALQRQVDLQGAVVKIGDFIKNLKVLLWN